MSGDVGAEVAALLAEKLEPHEIRLRALWRYLARKNIEAGTDWPHIARRMFADMDYLAERVEAAKAEAEAAYERGYDDALNALVDRCLRAEAVVAGIAPVADDRLRGKRQGVALARYYAEGARYRAADLDPEATP